MPEADLPQNQHSSEPSDFTDTHSFDPAETSVNRADGTELILSSSVDLEADEWETVNLPDAIPIDQLPVAQEAPAENESSDVSVGSTQESSTPLIQALHECNQDLASRVSTLEGELDECRSVLYRQEALLNQRTQELALAQEQVTRLFSKLELSNQVIRRQQVLAETLTEQWETSQTRMAQMERECAIAQQRYNEQFTELVQAQNTSRELRSRLHRQQRHTLQFKVALERCLEMQARLENENTVAQQTHSATVNIPTSMHEANSSSESVSFVVQSSQFSVPQSQPVKPWSAEETEEQSIERLHDLAETPVELSDQGVEAEPQGTQLPPINDSEPWDLEFETMNSDDLQVPTSDELLPLEELETYWHIESTPQPQTSIKQIDDSSIDQLSEPRFLEDELDRIRLQYGTVNPEDLNFIDPTPSFEMKPKTSTAESENLEPLVDESPSSEAVSAEEQTANWPAPLIHPQRQKKLQSLASIQLPRFPAGMKEVPVASPAEPF